MKVANVKSVNKCPPGEGRGEGGSQVPTRTPACRGGDVYESSVEPQGLWSDGAITVFLPLVYASGSTSDNYASLIGPMKIKVTILSLFVSSPERDIFQRCLHLDLFHRKKESGNSVLSFGMCFLIASFTQSFFEIKRKQILKANDSYLEKDPPSIL